MSHDYVDIDRTTMCHTLKTMGSNQYCPSTSRGSVKSVHWMKHFHDFRGDTTLKRPAVCRVRSVRVATALLISDGAIAIMFVGVCWLHTSCDHSTGFIQCRVQFLFHGWSAPTSDKHNMLIVSKNTGTYPSNY